MARRTTQELTHELVGAVMLGVGAILQPKARPDDHWSKTPKVEIHSEVGGQESGDPPRRRTGP